MIYKIYDFFKPYLLIYITFLNKWLLNKKLIFMFTSFFYTIIIQLIRYELPTDFYLRIKICLLIYFIIFYLIFKFYKLILNFFKIILKFLLNFKFFYLYYIKLNEIYIFSNNLIRLFITIFLYLILIILLFFESNYIPLYLIYIYWIIKFLFINNLIYSILYKQFNLSESLFYNIEIFLHKFKLKNNSYYDINYKEIQFIYSINLESIKLVSYNSYFNLILLNDLMIDE